MPDPRILATEILRFDPGGDPGAATSRRRILRLLETIARPFDRATFEPGHVTGSAIVLSPSRTRVLLVHHTRLGRWLQPGGHVEDADPSVADTARRETLEETGIRLDGAVPPVLVGLDVHAIPAAGDEPPHLHHDLVYRLVAAGPDQVDASEKLDTVWCAVGRLDDYGVDGAVRRAVACALALDG